MTLLKFLSLFLIFASRITFPETAVEDGSADDEDLLACASTAAMLAVTIHAAFLAPPLIFASPTDLVVISLIWWFLDWFWSGGFILGGEWKTGGGFGGKDTRFRNGFVNFPVQSTPCKALHYGPSLHKGRKLPQFQSPIVPSSLELNSSFEEESFTRVFDIAALRVPSDLCSSLESRLRGHLLNWPRIRNVARVPGDEIEDELKEFLVNRSNSDADGDSLVNLQRRIYGKAEGDGERLSPVLYRDKLSKTFNSKGFVNFRNLAKISRPKEKKKRGDGKEREKKGVGKNETALIEVVEAEVTGDEDMSGLLGDEFKGGKWRGSTRLLLLDEHCANKEFDEMPEAIKAVFREHSETTEKPAFEIVKCKLTLFYPYWQMDEVLEAILPEGMIVPSSFETVGHIAHLNLRDEHLPYKKLIAKVVLDKNKARIQTVVNKIDAIHSDYRTMQLEILAGNHSLVTRVIENGVHFHVDLATVYWNSRLATERQRLLSSFTHDDVNVLGDYSGRNHKYKQDSTCYQKDPCVGFSKAQDPEFDFPKRIRIVIVPEVAFEGEMRSVRAVAPGSGMFGAASFGPRRESGIWKSSV
nr:tRNA (guanine(37)-N1)-methyltransferase 1 [Ipomoea batatas]